MYTRPFLLTTLHPSHITLTEDRTFIPLVSIGLCVGWAWLCGYRGARFSGSWIVGWRTRVRRGRVDCRSARSILVVVFGSGSRRLRESDRIPALGATPVSAVHMSTSPHLGGTSALLVFILVLVAYVVESQLTQVSSIPTIGPNVSRSDFAAVCPSNTEISTAILPHVCPAVFIGH